MGNKLLLRPGCTPTSRWPAANELGDIFGSSFSHDVMSGNFFFNFIIFFNLSLFHSFCFYPTGPLHIYYMASCFVFLSVGTSGPLHLYLFLGFSLGSFLLLLLALSYPYWLAFVLFCFMLFYFIIIS